MKGLHILSIGELNASIKDYLESNVVFQSLWVKGEISNFTHHSSGHMYFTLKDEAGRMKSIMFAGNNRYLRFLPKNGMKVLVHGYVSVYEKDGQVQLYIQEMQPDGLGNLFLAFEQLKQKLQDEGLFEVGLKKTLPSFPKRIGLVTSSTGAAVRDIITTLSRRYPLANILLYPVLVQGQEAPRSIVKGIEWLNHHDNVDVIIVGRGGGALEELWAFNEEIVARAIFHSHIPIVSAVGHETDYTIADFVADMRAATPTAAAELLTPHVKDIRNSIDRHNQSLLRTINRKVQVERNRLTRMQRSAVLRKPKASFEQHEQHLKRLNDKLRLLVKRNISEKRSALNRKSISLATSTPVHKLALLRQKHDQFHKGIVKHAIRSIENKRKDWMSHVRQLEALSPLKIMQRGYSIVYKEDKKLFKSLHDVALGDIVNIQLEDGRLGCQVWEMEDKSNENKTG